MTYAKVTPALFLFTFIMLLLLLSKTHNMFVFVLLGTSAHFLPSIFSGTSSSIYFTITYFQIESKSVFYLRAFEIITITQWMGRTAFFGFGNSNTLSTIDIAGAYTGTLIMLMKIYTKLFQEYLHTRKLLLALWYS